jgi:hypothetical protein
MTADRAFESIGDLNAAINPVVNTRTLDAYNLPGLPTCLTQLIAALTVSTSAGTRDSATTKFLIETLKAPYNEARTALVETFIPNKKELDDTEGFGAKIEAYSQQMLTSMTNPVWWMLQMQRAVFQQSMANLGDLWFTDQSPEEKGLVSAIQDRVSLLLTQLFIDNEAATSNLGGLLLFAVEEAIPGIESELHYLREMRRNINTTVEETTKLPPSMVPQLPAILGALSLCDAERHLQRVARQLRSDRSWNRGEFQDATYDVCTAADIMKDGIIPSSLRGSLKTVTGWDDRQIAALSSLKFMPNVKFRLAIVTLIALNGALQTQDVSVLAFHRNLNEVLEVIESLGGIHIADFLAIIVEVVKNQIAALRLDLESQAKGFTGAIPAGFPSAADAHKTPNRVAAMEATSQTPDGGSESGTTRKNGQYATDIYAQLSAQISAYTMLYALCFVMKQTQRVQVGMQAILNANSRFQKMLVDFVSYYKAGDCGDDNGAATINLRLKSFLEAAEGRLTGVYTSNDLVCSRARDLEASIRKHEAFLQCMRERLLFGRKTIVKSVVMATNVLKALKTIRQLANSSADFYAAITVFDLKKFFGLEGKEYNALDAIIKALQCIVLQCDNPFASSLMQLAQTQFQQSLDLRKARGISVGSLDELPRTSRETTLNDRTAAFFRLVQSLQKLTAMPLDQICNIKASGTPEQKVVQTPPSSAAPKPQQQVLASEPVDTAARDSNEEQQRQNAGDTAKPLGAST